MRFEIQYCAACNYEPRALRARDRLRAKDPGAIVTMTKSSGGVFEILKDGRLVWSKKATGSFPTDQEVEALV
jgi:selenoprotein W-related protein